MDYTMPPALPPHPSSNPGWSKLSSEVRCVLNAEHRADVTAAYAAWAGRKMVDGFRPGAQLFCPECAACVFPAGGFSPVRGLDAEGRCAEDGEQVFWTIPAVEDVSPS